MANLASHLRDMRTQVQLEKETGIARRIAKREYDEWSAKQSRRQLEDARKEVAAHEYRIHLDLLSQMANKRSSKKIIEEAITEQNPAKLKKVFRSGMTWEDMLILRESVSNILIEPRLYKTVFDWLWHDDLEIARATRILSLWISDLDFQAELFYHLTLIETPKIPFYVDYNPAEKAFSIGIPGVPGWGVSYYGRENPRVDTLLHILEKLSARAHSET